MLCKGTERERVNSDAVNNFVCLSALQSFQRTINSAVKVNPQFSAQWRKCTADVFVVPRLLY